MIAGLWIRHRRALLTVVGGVSVMALAGAIVVAVSQGHPEPSTAVRRPAPRSPLTTPVKRRAVQTGDGGYHPRYVTVPQTARQTQLASALAAAESPQETAAGEALQVPVGRYSAEYPTVPGADTTDELSYARAWVTELLDADYRSQSRPELLAWAVEGQAANTLPGVPDSVQDKALYASLADPDLGSVGGASPVPSAATWSKDAVHGVAQRASGVEVSVDPQWTSLVSEGFVPTDPLLAFLDVSGTLTVKDTQGTAKDSRKARTARTPPPTTTMQFKLVLTVGSALRHPGYGAVSVEDWTVS